MGTLAIEADGLSKRFGRVWALAGVSFSLSRGHVLLVAGKNGSGKTTLFRVLTTAIRADGGTAKVSGVEIGNRFEVRRRTALLTHHAYSYESLSAAENIRTFAKFVGIDGTRVSEVLDEVGLAKRQHEPVQGFSAGMRKRLSIARLLLQTGNGAEVVFLDEPYAALDPEGLILIDGVVRRLREAGRTVLISSHLVERAAALADEAMILDGGRMVWSGRAAEMPA